MQAILKKHRGTVEELGTDLLLAKDVFLLGQRSHQRHLEGRRAVLQDEMARLQGEVARLTEELRRRQEYAVDWGDLRRREPISPWWGLERGKPLDRYYIETFLERHCRDIRGRVLEVKDSGYTERFGREQVTEREVLDIDPGNPNATLITDLTSADNIPPDHFDCVILTQTLQLIYDVRAALAHVHRILKPAGVLLCTLPAVSRIDYEYGGIDSGGYWRFTEASVRRLLSEVFLLDGVEVAVFGNIMACTAFLYGLAPDELERSELDHVDPWFPLLFCVRAVKAGRSEMSRHE